MNVGIVGGGINGLCCAWVLSQQGHNVHLYEQGALMRKTSCSSSKLLHGGLRYLEHGSFRLVRESLKERDEWLKRTPTLTNTVRIVLPIYKGMQRKRWIIKLGLFLYDNIAGKSTLPKSKWLDKSTILQKDPNLNAVGLIGGYEFSDGQMDDYKLGLWVAEQAEIAGSTLYENTTVKAIDEHGNIYLNNKSPIKYDRVINVAGPWAEELLNQSKLSAPYQLDAVRGSHLVINKPCKQSYLFEVPDEKRIFFVLPQGNYTLIGTTEVKQTLNEPIECSLQEQDYLLASYNHYHTSKITSDDILEKFAGIRPLLSSSTNPNDTTREYAIRRTNKLINVFGGKWTTCLALANKVSHQVQTT